MWHKARRSLLKTRQHVLNEAEAILIALPEEVQIELADDRDDRHRLRALATLDRVAITDTVVLLRLRLLDPATSDVTDLDVRDKTITSELASLVTAQKSTLAEPVRHRLDQGGNSKKPLDIGASAGPIRQARVGISSHL